MKCIGCYKKIDITEENPVNDEAQWYAKYKDVSIVVVICNDCIKDPVKKKKYLES